MKTLLRHLLLIILDLQTIVLGVFSVLYISGKTSNDLNEALWVFPTLLYLSHLSLGLYESKLRDSSRGVLRRITVSSSLTLIVTEIVVYFMGSEMSLSLWLPSMSIALFGQWLIRHWLFYHRGVGVSRRKVIVIGAGERAEFIARRMRRKKDRINLSSIGFVVIENYVESEFKNEIVYRHPLDWREFLNEQSPDIVVLAQDEKENLPIDVLLDVKLSGVEVLELEDFVEAELGQIALEKMPKTWLLTTDNFKSDSRGFPLLNVIFNKALALTVLCFAWPIMLGTALAIYLDDGRKTKSSIFYRQIRVGKNGKIFEILKFRSMGENAESEGAQWATKNDQRVTRIGGILRKYRLDELPQLLNVIRGDMVFVGPRPERPEFTETLSMKYPLFPLRNAVTPGLTGWAQLKYPYGSNDNDSFEKLKFDLYYIKHRSLLLDIFILIRTVEIVLFGRGR